MIPIIIEGALFVALVAAVGALLLTLLYHYTPLGLAWKQRRNRQLLERETARNCPRHGLQREAALVRLRDGQTLCPQCYQEILDGKLD
jgi:hypothetical protein